MQDRDGIKWEQKPDGMYLTVTEAASLSVDLTLIRRDLDAANVVNYDWDRIKQVLVAGRGRPEFVGKPFQYFDPAKLDYIELVAKPERAILRIQPRAEKEGVQLGMADLEYALKRKGVVFGVDWGVVSEIVKKRLYGQEITVAKAQPAVQGKDAKIEELVRIDPDARPVILADGTADFKNLNNLTQVKDGQDIAIKHPPTQGKAGMSVFGKEIPPFPGEDRALPSGKNTVISNDGLTLKAKSGGYLYRNAEMICVGELYVVNSDIDFKSGNIKYGGDVLVVGEVKSGFFIEADGNVKVEGNVEGARIRAGGNIQLMKGVFGHDKADIKAKGDIFVSMAQDATIECDGRLTVKKSLRNCVVRAGILDASARGCLVSGGELVAHDEIILAQAGVENTPTRLFLVDRHTAVLKKKMEELVKGREKLVVQLEPMERRLRSMRTMMGKMDMTARAQQEVKTAVESYAANKKRLEFMDQQIAKIKQELEQPSEFPGKVRILESVLDTVLDMHGFVKELNPADLKKEIIWTEGGLKATEPAPA